MGNVMVIPAKRQVGNTARQQNAKPKLRVAAYCRVSTDSDEQATSYDAQVEHYTEFIQKNPEWEFAGIYADDGISGTNTKKREDFNRMIDDCEAGNIDMIITKSISRFARNTLDCLKYIRQLKDKNIPVFFEKEAINTMDAKGEVLITIMASLAQQESQSLSQNVKLGLQFRYQNGQVQVNHNHFLGYKLLFILIHFSDFHIHHSVKQEMYSIIFLEQIDMLAQSNQIVLRPNRTDC